jgi:hypothetical protein
LSRCIAYWDGRETFEARRARKAIRSLVNKFQSVPLENEPGPMIEKAIIEIEQWQDPKLLPERYIQHLKGDIDDLLSRIDVSVIAPMNTTPVTTVFEKISACVPDSVMLIEVVEKLKIIVVQIPNLPHLRGQVIISENCRPKPAKSH